MYVMYVIPHISNRILDFFWELPNMQLQSNSWLCPKSKSNVYFDSLYSPHICQVSSTFWWIGNIRSRGIDGNWYILYDYKSCTKFLDIFFLRGGSLLELQDSFLLSITLFLSFKFTGGIQQSNTFIESNDTAQPHLFYLLRVHPDKAQGPRSASLSFPVPGIHIQCVPTFPFLHPHLLHEGVFALLILCSIYCWLNCSVRNPTSILQCFLSSLLINWTYLSVCPSRHSWLVQYLPQTLHSVCSLFPI